MAMYYFNVHGTPLDDIGEDLASDELAWKEATTFAGEIFRDVDGKLRPDSGWELQVTDQNQKPLFLIQISTKKFS
jgi:hypothetical protein